MIIISKIKTDNDRHSSDTDGPDDEPDAGLDDDEKSFSNK